MRSMLWIWNDLFSEIKFGKAIHRDGSEAPNLVEVILQNYQTKDVLFGASMTKENLLETLDTGFIVLYSKSRKTRWLKGETSGDKLELIRITLNCNCDQLLIEVEPKGKGVCHEKDENGKSKPTCFSKIYITNK